MAVDRSDDAMSEEWPSASILLPVLDEAAGIDACLDSLLEQDYTGALEIVVADGGSTDGTRSRLEARSAADARVRWLDNPGRLQSHGLNAAAACATGTVLVRADAHTTYAEDYVRRSVARVAPLVAAGGPMRPVGTTRFGRAVAAAMRSPLAIGPATFHHAEEVREADTVYLGAFRREDFLANGGYRTFPSGVAEDADFYFRWRRRGGRVVVDPSIRSQYRPRETVRTLARQNLRYGQGKAEMLYVNGAFPSWRPLGPTALVVGLVATGAVAVVTRLLLPLAGLLVAWAGILAAAGASCDSGPADRALVALAAGVMQLAYGVGLLQGLLRGPTAARSGTRTAAMAEGQVFAPPRP